jgi:hypothetical protein
MYSATLLNWYSAHSNFRKQFIVPRLEDRDNLYEFMIMEPQTLYWLEYQSWC